MKAPRFAFSIMSLSLLTALIAVSVSRHVQLKRANEEIARLQSANHELESEAGFLDVQDPQKAYVMPLKCIDDLTWRFRIYTPPKSNVASFSFEGTRMQRTEST